MKKVFPAKLLVNPGFTPTASNWFGIKNENFFKGRYYSFKDQEQLLKDTDSCCAGTISGHSLTETGIPVSHFAL